MSVSENSHSDVMRGLIRQIDACLKTNHTFNEFSSSELFMQVFFTEDILT